MCVFACITRLLGFSASTADLQSQILSVTSCATDIYFDTHLNTWQTTFGSVPVSEPLHRKQSFWDRPGILASRAVVESNNNADTEDSAYGAVIVTKSLWQFTVLIRGMHINKLILCVFAGLLVEVCWLYYEVRTCVILCIFCFFIQRGTAFSDGTTNICYNMYYVL